MEQVHPERCFIGRVRSSPCCALVSPEPHAPGVSRGECSWCRTTAALAPRAPRLSWSRRSAEGSTTGNTTGRVARAVGAWWSSRSSQLLADSSRPHTPSRSSPWMPPVAYRNGPQRPYRDRRRTVAIRPSSHTCTPGLFIGRPDGRKSPRKPERDGIGTVGQPNRPSPDRGRPRRPQDGAA